MSNLARDLARKPEGAAVRHTLRPPIQAAEPEAPRRLRNVIMVRTFRQQDAETRPDEWLRLALWVWTPGIGFVVGLILAFLR